MRLPDRIIQHVVARRARGAALQTLHGLVIVAVGLTIGSGQSTQGCGSGCAQGAALYQRDNLGHYVPAVQGERGELRCVGPAVVPWSSCASGSEPFWEDGVGRLHPLGDPNVGELERIRCVAP